MPWHLHVWLTLPHVAWTPFPVSATGSRDLLTFFPVFLSDRTTFAHSLCPLVSACEVSKMFLLIDPEPQSLPTLPISTRNPRAPLMEMAPRPSYVQREDGGLSWVGNRARSSPTLLPLHWLPTPPHTARRPHCYAGSTAHSALPQRSRQEAFQLAQPLHLLHLVWLQVQ